MSVALDTNTDFTYFSTTAASRTISHDGGSGTDRCTVVIVYTVELNVTATATYNGVSMTLLDRVARGDANRYIHFFYLVGSATGTNNVTVSVSPNARMAIAAATFSGVDQTTPIDSQYAVQKTTASTSQTASLTASVTGTAGIGVFIAPSSSEANNSAGSNAQVLQEHDITAMFASADIPILGSGQYDITMNCASSVSGMIAALLKPSAGAPVNTTNFFYMV